MGSGAGAGSPAVHTPPAGGVASNHGAHASRCGHPPALTLRRQPASHQAELGHQLAVRPWPQLDHSEPLYPCFPSCLEGNELPPSNDLALSQGIPALLRRTLKWGILPCPQRSGDPPWGLGRPHSASVSLSAPGTLSSCQSAKVALGVLPGRRDIGEEGSKRCSQGGSSGKESACRCRRRKRRGFNPWVGKIPWRRKWPPAPVFLPGKFHGQRSLAGYSLRDGKASDMTERAHGQKGWRRAGGSRASKDRDSKERETVRTRVGPPAGGAPRSAGGPPPAAAACGGRQEAGAHPPGAPGLGLAPPHRSTPVWGVEDQRVPGPP